MTKIILIILTFTFATVNTDASKLIQAVKSGHLAQVKTLLDRGASLSERDTLGRTALMWAVQKSNLEIVSLASRGVDAAQRRPKTTMWRAESAYNQIVRLLLQAEKNPRVQQATHPQRNQNRNLINAIISGSANEVREFLRQGANPNAFDRNRPALIWAAFWGHRQIVSLLLEAGAKTELKDDHGFTARMWAEERGHADIAALLQQVESGE